MSLSKQLYKWIGILFLTLGLLSPVLTTAQGLDLYTQETIGRANLVKEQITLLNNRLEQSEEELSTLQKQSHAELTQITTSNVSTKSYLDKAALDISVATSNLDSINIELSDTQQIINWLEKNIQEIENQLNVLGIFGLKVTKKDAANVKELQKDLSYQRNLLTLEKSRLNFLQKLQNQTSSILQLRTEHFNRLTNIMRSSTLLHIKRKQAKDELLFQQKQNAWLSQVNNAYAKLDKLDPKKSANEYASIERDIFYANENANLTYIQSLIARYKDQIQQMKLTVVNSNSITLLNEVSDQVQTLNKQIGRLDSVLKNRVTLLDKHINYLAKKDSTTLKEFVKKLDVVKKDYKAENVSLNNLAKSISEFRDTLEQAIQNELSSRRGLPAFTLKSVLDIGKEMLLVPALTFHVVKSLSGNVVKGIQSTTPFAWSFFIFLEAIAVFTFLSLRKALSMLLERPSQWRDQINSKWISLQWLRRNLPDIFILGNVFALLYFFGVPQQNYLFLIYLSIVWLSLKSIITISRLCLVETTHDAQGHDIKLYRRLQWIVTIGGLITALTVFVHQLPLIYEIKTLFDTLFLLLLMVVSLLLLRSEDVIQNIIMPHMESRHPYLKKSIRLIGLLIPLLMFANSIIGLFGYINLVLTVSWYEGIFLVVLVGYLILRGLLSDGMEQLSRLMIQYVNNGWLLTEAVLKPLDNVLRISLFLMAWAVLFLLYGWDQQSPIVERLMRLMHYQLTNVLNTTITPLNIIELCVVISIFYWTAKWIREFVYRLLLSRTKDMGIRNSIAIISQYTVVILGGFLCLRVLGIDLTALAAIMAALAFGVGFGLRDLANNFVTGFLILLERPIRVGDIVNVNGIEGEVLNIGGRAVTIRTWDHMDLMVPNSEIFNKCFTNLTAHDNVVRSVVYIKISRHDNPHEVKVIIQNVLSSYKDILSDPMPEVYLKEMSEICMNFELRYYVNIRQVISRTGVMSGVLMAIWDEFLARGIKPAYPQQEITIRGESSVVPLVTKGASIEDKSEPVKGNPS